MSKHFGFGFSLNNKTCGKCGKKSRKDMTCWLDCPKCNTYYHCDCVGGGTRIYDCEKCVPERWNHAPKPGGVFTSNSKKDFTLLELMAIAIYQKQQEEKQQ